MWWNDLDPSSWTKKVITNYHAAFKLGHFASFSECFTMTLVSDWIETQVPQRFSCSQTSMRQRGKMRQNLWVRTLGPLNAPIQSEAVCDVSESDFNLKSSQRACDWISTSKGPNLGIHRFSHIRLHLFTPPLPLTLVCMGENFLVAG